jgi:hypothetical protein
MTSIVSHAACNQGRLRFQRSRSTPADPIECLLARKIAVEIPAAPAKLRWKGNTPHSEDVVTRLTARTISYSAGRREVSLDVIVTPTADGKIWSLTDLLGRPMGRIVETSLKQFTIHPHGHAFRGLVGVPGLG